MYLQNCRWLHNHDKFAKKIILWLFKTLSYLSWPHNCWDVEFGTVGQIWHLGGFVQVLGYSMIGLLNFGSIFWFQFFFISESHCFYFCPVGDSQYYMKLTFSKLGIGGIWQLSKNHCPEKGGCPKKSCPQSESCCPTMKSSPQPQRFPPSDLEVQLSATPLPTPCSCLSNCRQWCCSHSRSLTPNPTTT